MSESEMPVSGPAAIHHYDVWVEVRSERPRAAVLATFGTRADARRFCAARQDAPWIVPVTRWRHWLWQQPSVPETLSELAQILGQDADPERLDQISAAQIDALTCWREGPADAFEIQMILDLHRENVRRFLAEEPSL